MSAAPWCTLHSLIDLPQISAAAPLSGSVDKCMGNNWNEDSMTRVNRSGQIAEVLGMQMPCHLQPTANISCMSVERVGSSGYA